MYTASPDVRPTIHVLTKTFGTWRIDVQRQPIEKHALRKHYDRQASRWQRIMRQLKTSEAYADAILSIAHRLPGASPKNDGAIKLLDCGTGTGVLTSAMAKARPQARLTAVDLSPKMLREAKQNFKANGLAVHTRLADVGNLTFGDNSFDIVMGAHVLEHLDNPGHGLKEMIRTARPGGQIILLLTRQTWAGRYIQLKWRTHIFSTDDARHLLRSQGLENVEIKMLRGTLFTKALGFLCIAQVPYP